MRLATTAARQAAEYLRTVERPRDPATWKVKGPSDFVSAADRRSEELIRDILQNAEPASTIMGEELSPDTVDRGLVWIVDPIDGTTNFLHGFPVYSVSIAASVDGVLEAGVVLWVETNQLFHAARGHGAFEGVTRLRVSTIGDPKHALIGTGFPFKHPAMIPAYQAQFRNVLLGSSGIRRAGSAALDLCWVAAGVFDGFWEMVLAPWDMAAGLLLVREAGGVVTDLEGREVGPMHGPLVAGNPGVHAWLLDTLTEGRWTGDGGPGTGENRDGK
jgi:myo-inositol-1(or 4)-monophosphatase